MTPLAAYLRERRVAAGLSQINVGVLLGHADGSTVKDMERGGYCPSEAVLPYLCAMIGADLERALALRRETIAAHAAATSWR